MTAKRQTKREKDLYRLAVMLLAENPRNYQWPTTRAAAAVTDAFRVSFEKLFQDAARFAELSNEPPANTSSDEFRQWWDKEIGE